MDKHLPILGGKYQYQYLRSLALDTGQDIGCHKISHLSTQTGKEEIMFRIYIYLFIFYPVTCKCEMWMCFLLFFLLFSHFLDIQNVVILVYKLCLYLMSESLKAHQFSGAFSWHRIKSLVSDFHGGCLWSQKTGENHFAVFNFKRVSMGEVGLKCLQ